MNLDLMKDGIEGREIPYPIAFNEYGAAEFNTWLRRHWRHEVKPNTAGAFFSEISNFESGPDVAVIELGARETISRHPETFLVTAEMVEFICEEF